MCLIWYCLKFNCKGQWMVEGKYFVSGSWKAFWCIISVPVRYYINMFVVLIIINTCLKIYLHDGHIIDRMSELQGTGLTPFWRVQHCRARSCVLLFKFVLRKSAWIFEREYNHSNESSMFWISINLCLWMDCGSPCANTENHILLFRTFCTEHNCNFKKIGVHLLICHLLLIKV